MHSMAKGYQDHARVTGSIARMCDRNAGSGRDGPMGGDHGPKGCHRQSASQVHAHHTCIFRSVSCFHALAVLQNFL